MVLLLQASLSYKVLWDKNVSLHHLFWVLEKALYRVMPFGSWLLSPPWNTEMTDGIPAAKLDQEAALRLEAKGDR